MTNTQNKNKFQNSFLVFAILLILALIKNLSFLKQSIFDADQEYLALSGSSILSGDFTLLGAPTSVGGMFVGPLYNYVVAFFLFLFRGNPYVINGLSFFWVSLTIPLIYVLGKKLIGAGSALFAALLALASSEFINHFAAPPLLFPLPLITLLVIYLLSTTKKKKSILLLVGVLVGLSLNLHFSGVFLVPLVIFSGLFGCFGLLIPLAPLFFFEIRHRGLLMFNVIEFMRDSAGQSSSLLWRASVYFESLAGLIALGPMTIIWKLVATLIVMFGIIFLPSRILKTVLLLPLFFFVIYPGHLLLYYAMIAWVPFLFVCGYLFSLLWKRYAILKIGIVAFFVLLINQGHAQWKTRYTFRSLDKKIAILQYIRQSADDQPFYISRTMDPAANFGFDYLISWMKLYPTDKPVDPTYTIVAPFNFENIKSDMYFGDFGLILPRKQ